MNRLLSFFGIGLLGSCSSLAALGQTTAQLQTTDTVLCFEAGTIGPRLIRLQPDGQEVWTNRASEALIDHVEIDGQRKTLDWKFNPQASQIDANRVAFVYDSASPRLRLTWEWRVRAAYGPIEHRISIENLTSREIWMPFQDSFNFDWQIDPKRKLEQLYIDKGAGTPTPVGTHQVPLPDGYNWEGISTPFVDEPADEPSEIIPWFLLEDAEGSRNGWYVGIEFSGCVRLSLARDGESMRGAAGLNPNPGPFRTRVGPGGGFETPTIFVGGCSGGPDAAGNVLHRWVRHVLTNPLTWANSQYPLLVNNSWGSGMDVNEAVARHMIRDSAELGLEMFHIDAGWYRGVGDWYPDPKKFPHGLSALADDAHQHGLKFGLWVAWTQAGLGTDPGALNVRDPIMRDWLITDPPKDWKVGAYEGIPIDLGVPAAQAWAQREVDRIVRDYHLDMLEHDGYLVVKSCDRADHPHASPTPAPTGVSHPTNIKSNSTDVSYHAARAYYEVYSTLRKEHPGLLLEMCNDGGQMVDFGSASHGDYFSITDAYDPLSNRRAFYDASYVLPPAMLECYVEKRPTPHIENFRYMLRSGMMGWLTVMIDTTAWTPEQHAVAREEFQDYKTELRPLIRDADLYHISPRPDGVHWDSIEYFDPRSRKGVVYAFRGSTKTESSHLFILQGLRAEGTYRLHFHDGSAPDKNTTGRELCGKGLTIKLPAPDSSELLFIDEVASAPLQHGD